MYFKWIYTVPKQRHSGIFSSKSVTIALDAGFRKFDTAEAEYWYDQEAVGTALGSFFVVPELLSADDSICSKEDLRISTKIPPWELISIDHIRTRAAESRKMLVGFCDLPAIVSEGGDKNDGGRTHHHVRGGLEREETTNSKNYPLDVYYIHAPKCWPGWHSRCDNVTETLPLREAWLGMEAVVGLDHNAKRIGLSNVHPDELLDIIQFVKDRESLSETEYGSANHPPPRMPDVLQAYADPLRPASELRQICNEHNIEFVSYSTLGSQHTMSSGGSNPILGSVAINELAANHERSTAEVVLSWALQRGMSVIPRSSNEAHIRQLANLLTEDPFLEEEDLAIIDEMGDDLNEL